jgi:hypothetical protein
MDDPGLTEAVAPGARAAADGIRPEAIAGHIRFLADHLLEGGEPGGRGYQLAARYVAAQLQGLGAQPAGENGTWFQPVVLKGAFVRSASLEISGSEGGSAALVKDRDFTASAELDRGVAEIEAPLVFAGHGLEVVDYHYDDFAGVDVRGKVVVVLAGAPRSDRPDFFPSLASDVYGDGEHARKALKRRGALAVLAVWTPVREALIPFPRLVQHGRFESMRLASEPAELPHLLLSGAAFESLLRRAGRTETLQSLVEACARGEPRPFDLGLRARLRIDSPLRTLASVNVVGLLPGDPKSPTTSEVVVYGAHLDHMGVGPAVDGDTIYNGASDDAAGVASLLETARAFTKLPRPPARSVLFLFVTAEERGLLGSKWFADHPTLPRDRIVANVDVDAAYPIRPLRDVVTIGWDHSSLRSDVERAAYALRLQISPDPEPDQNYFVRADNYSFVRQGIPALQTNNGQAGLTAEQKAADEAFWRKRYHQPQHEFEPSRDWTPFADLTRFNFLLGLSIAQRADRPAWNPGDWFRRFPEGS